MNKNHFLMLLFAVIMPIIVACSSSEENSVVPPNDDEPVISETEQTSLIIINNIDDYWSRLIIESNDKYAFVKDMEDGSQTFLGIYEDTKTYINLDAQKRPEKISFEGFDAEVNYRGDKAFVFCVAGETMFCDTINLSDTPENASTRAMTRAVSAEGVYKYMKTWVSEKGLRYVVNYAVDKSSGNPILSTFLDYLRNTEDLNSREKLNYNIKMFENWDTYALSIATLGIIPQEWFQKAKDELKEYVEEKKINEKTVATIIVGLVTGNAPYIYNESAICLVDGYLKASANEGSFNFDYGICYSENSNPTINDNVSKKNVQSGLINSITLSLPDKFILSNLKKNTKYYYRAYFKDNENNIIDYSDVIRSFSTSEIPASISNFAQTNSYCKENGYSNNGKTYSYKFMTTLKAELESFNDIMDWGYYYINESGNRVAFSMMSRGTLRCDDVLEYYSNKPETTIKLGCYVKYTSIGDKAFYSDPQNFNLKYNDEITLSFTDCNYIEVTHDNSLGYYRCGVTFDVSFKVKGSENLTSIVILPYGNFLSWNAPSYYNPSDGDFKTIITDQYLYEYGLFGNFYCYLYAKDINGKEYYSDNMVKLDHDGYHFTACSIQSWESLQAKAAVRKLPVTKSIPKHE